MKSSIIKTGTMLAGFLLAACLSTHAEVKLPAIFSDGMVMQQQTNANLWGTATPHKKVTVTTSWNGKQYAATADKNGAWKLTVATPEAGGPYTVTFDDGTQKTLNNILIGELWLCSGQSNMEMPMKGFKNQPVENANMDILHSKNPQIRLFTVKRTSTFTPQNDVIGSWKEATPASVRDFSATAYYFGRLVNEILDVPVGLVVAAWGGSACEAWMTADWLKAFPEVVINSPDNAVPEVLNFSENCIKSETMLAFLAEEQIYVSSASACGRGQPSHTLAAMGRDPLAIDTAIRVSFCADNTPEDVDAFLNRFEDGMKHLQRIKK